MYIAPLKTEFTKCSTEKEGKTNGPIKIQNKERRTN